MRGERTGACSGVLEHSLGPRRRSGEYCGRQRRAFSLKTRKWAVVHLVQGTPNRPLRSGAKMPAVAREITLRFLAAPTDADISGSVSGGRVLEWIDKAGYACAVGWAGTYSVTAYVGNVRFSRPVKVGDLVEATAQLIHTGRSSMHILVTVSSGNARDRLLTEATKCLIIFVAMGPEGRSTPVPPWQPITDEDREQQASAQRRVALRADIEAAM